jgi:hypothetical protein
VAYGLAEHTEQLPTLEQMTNERIAAEHNLGRRR